MALWSKLVNQRYTCDQCGRSYKHKSNLCNHKREECGRPPSYFCPVCKKGFKKKQHMQRHFTVHNDVTAPPAGFLDLKLEDKSSIQLQVPSVQRPASFLCHSSSTTASVLSQNIPNFSLPSLNNIMQNKFTLPLFSKPSEIFSMPPVILSSTVASNSTAGTISNTAGTVNSTAGTVNITAGTVNSTAGTVNSTVSLLPIVSHPINVVSNVPLPGNIPSTAASTSVIRSVSSLPYYSSTQSVYNSTASTLSDDITRHLFEKFGI